MKKTTDYLLIAAVVIFGLFFLYQKGYIFAPYERVSPQEAYAMIRKNDGNTTLLDVRTQEEYNEDGHLSGAELIPLDMLASRLDLFSPYKETAIIVYCRSGNRSVVASRILTSNGYHVYNLDGGINAWKQEHLPVETIRLGRPR